MILQKNGRISVICLILLLFVSAFLVCFTPVKAAEIQPRAFLAVNPNPVGLGQVVDVTITIQPIPPLATDKFHGMYVSITSPDGSVETRGPLTSSPIGSQYFVYTPTMLGTYKFQFSYEGETFEYGGGTVYKPAESPITELVVQQDQIQPYPDTPTPTDYWTRPINAQHRNWNMISGNWLLRAYDGSGRTFGEVVAFNPYSQAARAPHVMWTKELTFGGLIGGEFGAYSYYGGQSYEPKLSPPIIMNGRLYYKIYQSGFSGSPGSIGTGFVCVDLRTGEEIFRNIEGSISHGQIYNFISANQMGGIAYLWDIMGLVVVQSEILPGVHKMYDAFTGDLLMTFTNALGGIVKYDYDGTMLIYTLNGEKGWFAMWNSSLAFEKAGFMQAQPSGLIQYRPRSGTYDWSLGLQWNHTVPIRKANVAYPTNNGAPSLSFPSFYGDILVAYGGGVTESPLHVGYSLSTGEEVWAFDRSEEEGGRKFPVFSAFGEGMYAQFDPANMVWIGYDINTGIKKWVSDPMAYPFGQYPANSIGGIIAYGKLYAVDMQGYIHAYDTSNGKMVWEFSSGNSGLETPYGSWPMGAGPILADGVVYCGIGEHSPTNPLMRGGRLFALDANTGDKLWEMNGWISIDAIADGYLVGYNLYDNRIYTIGKGPSATTVNASPKVIPKGGAVLIEGSVTDQSSGQPDTPAIADANMGAWMAYLKQQQTCPADANGVMVTLQAIDNNGATTNIGTVNSDAYGCFEKMWTPPNEGEYKIIATFAGSNSYGSSYAETAVGVGSASASPTDGSNSGDGTSSSSLDTLGIYIIVATIVIIIAIAIAVLLLRKR